MTVPPEDVTLLLREADADAGASARLFELVYRDLRAIAGAQMRHERDDHTLQATALVSEAFIRLVGGAEVTFEDRQHFFRVATEAMRRVLIDHARAHKADKRGGGDRGRALLDADGAIALDPEKLLALDEALSTLETEDERAAALVRYRFYAGMTIEQAGELLGLSRRTAMRDWNFARARLTELLEDDG
ncbi:MAG: extracytoplasmic sigma factor ECF [Phycisphaeraceae bacterium]|nr:MAG: extracytoplasmic sigma factor ECF [Phycisphaeraceae bacterium]